MNIAHSIIIHAKSPSDVMWRVTALAWQDFEETKTTRIYSFADGSSIELNTETGAIKSV
jgi:hypothetical protein